MTYKSSMLTLVATAVVLALLVQTDGSTTTLAASSQQRQANGGRGVDDAWPTHHVDAASAQSSTYVDYMQGCYRQFGKDPCDQNEAKRIALNLNQPVEQRNLTSTGYSKIKAPAKSFRKLQAFVEEALLLFNQEDNPFLSEDWGPANVHTNHWQVGNSVLLLDDPDNTGAGLSHGDRRQLLREVQVELERWSGVTLIPALMYGVRIYQPGSIVAPHVDRLPLVMTAVICVAESSSKNEGKPPHWVLELVGHDGVALDIVTAPGDMVMYQGNSVIHGRPRPFQGNFYASVVLQFEAVGYTFEMEKKLKLTKQKKTAKELFEAALAQQEDDGGDTDKKKANEKRYMSDLPGYIPEYSGQAAQWRQQFEFFRQDKPKTREKPKKYKTSGVTKAHVLAAHGDIETLKQVVELNGPSVLHESDSNGWKPIHEAARSGETETIQYLIDNGVDVNARTNRGNGGTPLWWAEHMLPATHPAVKVLRKNGAVSIAPGD